jgi:hypothetical protein
MAIPAISENLGAFPELMPRFMRFPVFPRHFPAVLGGFLALFEAL